jgi:hypothetical protein
MPIRKCARHLSSTVAHTPVTNREIAYRDIAIPIALVHRTLQVLNPEMVTPVLHYLPLWPTRLSRRDIADCDSNVWEFLTSRKLRFSDARLLGSPDTRPQLWMAQSSSGYRGSRFQAAIFLFSHKPQFSDARLPWIS